MVREKHTSTIWALAAGHYDRKQMVRLFDHYAVNHSSAPYVAVPMVMTLSQHMNNIAKFQPHVRACKLCVSVGG